MPATRRLPSRQRRDAIVDAVKGAFAEKGFDGATTRELARAAGVSEALLYRYFPSKDSLYAAMLEACARGPVVAEFNRVLALPPSTATLVTLVHFLVSRLLLADDPHKVAMDRLALRSLLEDGDFVRLGTRRFASTWVRKVEACLAAAARAGDLREGARRRDLAAWFVHHLAFGLMAHIHPRRPAVDYRASKRALVDAAVRFALLGLGLEAASVRRHCAGRALRSVPVPAAARAR
jgi:AcrR family transcriptional regulator